MWLLHDSRLSLKTKGRDLRILDVGTLKDQYQRLLGQSLLHSRKHSRRASRIGPACIFRNLTCNSLIVRSISMLVFLHKVRFYVCIVLRESFRHYQVRRLSSFAMIDDEKRECPAGNRRWSKTSKEISFRRRKFSKFAILAAFTCCAAGATISDDLPGRLTRQDTDRRHRTVLVAREHVHYPSRGI